MTLSQFKRCHTILKRFDRITEGVIYTLAWLFVIGVVVILVLAVTGLAKRWSFALAVLGKHIAMFIMFPLLFLWFGGGALRLLASQMLVSQARRGRASKQSVALFIWLAAVALAILAAVIAFAAKIYSR